MISNCDDVRGTLPWLLNGTLSDDDRHQVLGHLTTCASCRQDLADTRLAAEIFDQHPPAEAILALAWDDPPRGVDPTLLEHLETCPRCAAELELARMSRRLEEDEKIVPLARRAAAAPAAPAQSSTGWRGWKASALAAALAGVVAFAGWFQTVGRVHTLEEQLVNRTAPPISAPPTASGESKQAQQLADERGRQIEQLQARLNEAEQKADELNGQVEQLGQIARAQPAAPAPQINTWLRSVQPSGDVVRGGGPAAALEEVPARASAVLLLTARHQETHKNHALEIVDSSGKGVWKADGLALDPETGSYALALPPGFLPAGTYTIRVFGTTADGRREPVESYSIRVG